MFEDFRYASLQLAQNGSGGSPPAVSKVKFSKDEPLEISILALFPIQQRASKKLKELMLNSEILPTKKPDSDNIIKIILDALNGVAKQILKEYKPKDEIWIIAKYYSKQHEGKYYKGFIVREIITEQEIEKAGETLLDDDLPF